LYICQKNHHFYACNNDIFSLYYLAAIFVWQCYYNFSYNLSFGSRYLSVLYGYELPTLIDRGNVILLYGMVVLYNSSMIAIWKKSTNHLSV